MEKTRSALKLGKLTPGNFFSDKRERVSVDGWMGGGGVRVLGFATEYFKKKEKSLKNCVQLKIESAPSQQCKVNKYMLKINF
jgi:hypothetical protein